MVSSSFSRCSTPELPSAPPLPGTSQSVCARRLSRQPSVSTAAARNGVYLEWEQGSEDRCLADGSQTEPDATSCSGFPKGSQLSPWAVTHSTTYTYTHTHTRTHTQTHMRTHTHTRTHMHTQTHVTGGVISQLVLTACFLYVLYRLSSEPYWHACKRSHCLSTTSTWTPPLATGFFKNRILSHTSSFTLFISLFSSVMLAVLSHMWVCGDGGSNRCFGGERG